VELAFPGEVVTDDAIFLPRQLKAVRAVFLRLIGIELTVAAAEECLQVADLDEAAHDG
jgi:hypothetical protein